MRDNFKVGLCVTAAHVRETVGQAVAVYLLGKLAANLVALGGRLFSLLALLKPAVPDAAAVVAHPVDAAHDEMR